MGASVCWGRLTVNRHMLEEMLLYIKLNIALGQDFII
jgi:hypothetical protein